jgi:hypothetical protein
MTEEEKLKYGIAERVEDENMADKKMTKERLIELCNEHGFGKEAYTKIAEIIGVAPHSVECTVSRLGIRKIVEGDGITRPAEVSKETVQTLSEQDASAVNSHEEHPDCPENEIKAICKVFGVPDSELKKVKSGIGRFSEERCPECGAHLLINDYGDKWCSLIGCTYGLKESVKTEDSLPAQVHSKTKYYIATGYPHKDRAEQLASIIKAAGGEITYEWWANNESGDPAELAEIGKAEFQGIRDCDVFICLMPGFHGTHSELGAAIILGKRVIMHEADEAQSRPVVPCYYQDNVRRLFGSELQLVAEILRGA